MAEKNSNLATITKQNKLLQSKINLIDDLGKK